MNATAMINSASASRVSGKSSTVRSLLWPAEARVALEVIGRDGNRPRSLRRTGQACPGGRRYNPPYMPIAPGSRVGPYDVRELVGEGGMGSVYRATDTRLGRDVAVKCVRPDSADGDGADARKRILREAQTASSLNHPHIAAVFDVGETEGEAWIAMELVDGRPLSAIVEPGGLPPETVTRYGIQIADALAHAHARGVTHRDLKPANIVCGPEDRLKVLDFGLAARLPEATAAEVTRTAVTADPPADVLAGTLPYMAPETLRGRPPDAAADLWAFGVMLHELIGGSRPFRAQTTHELVAAILADAPPPLPANTPAALVAVVARLLQKDPARRFRSAGEVRAVLESLADQSSTGRVPSPSAAGPRRPRAGAFAALVLLLALAGASALFWWPAEDRLVLEDHQLLSTFAGAHRSPSLSPDGSRLAFVAADADGVPQVWIRDSAQGAPVAITSGGVPASRPRWSPAGDRVVFVRAGLGIWSVPWLGGAPTRLLEFGTNPNLAANGTRLVFEHERNVWIADADGSSPRQVEGVPSQYYSIARRPALSPDGQTIAFFHAEAGPNGDLWTVPAEGGDARRLTVDMREGGAPAWTPDGRWIVFSSARAGSRTLWQIPARGGTPLPLTTGSGEDDEPEISRDGTRLVYSNVKHSWTLVVRDEPDAPDRPVLERHTEILFPAFSPDGTRIVFFGRQDRAVAVSTIGVDGSDLRHLTGGTELNHQPLWSADGRSVYFYQILPTPSVRRVPAEGGPDELVWPWTWEVQNAAQFDPSGSRVAYVRRGAGEATVIHDVGTGDEHELGRPIYTPKWSPDGRWIAGWRDGRVTRCLVDTGACEDVTAGIHARYGPGGSTLYFMRPLPNTTAHELWAIDIDTRVESRLGQVGPFRYIDRHVDVSSRGAIAWASMHAGRPELWAARLGR
ncbi:MAG TPA: LpqB family beta-propeller domain-containing protein [Vicinamibacterales bacterium]|nr:LpqB family beta-propeller domain-containing protein [Vicinamibacterales bacterium]